MSLMRLNTRLGKLEARAAERLATPDSPEAKAWIAAHYDLAGWIESWTDAERLTYDALEGVELSAMSDDDLEIMAGMAERFEDYRRP